MYRLGIIILIAIAFLLAIGLCGCASTARISKDDEINQLRMQVNQLQAQGKQKDEKIAALARIIEEGNKEKLSVQPKHAQNGARMTPENIQLALKRSGYYKGVIDGKVGDNTINAVKEFQRANNMPVDGVVGKQTWEKLKRHL